MVNIIAIHKTFSDGVLFIPFKKDIKDIAYLPTYWECESKVNSRCGDYLFNCWNSTSR